MRNKRGFFFGWLYNAAAATGIDPELSCYLSYCPPPQKVTNSVSGSLLKRLIRSFMYFYGRFITMFLLTTNETGDLRGRPQGLMGLESRTMDVFWKKLIWKSWFILTIKPAPRL